MPVSTASLAADRVPSNELLETLLDISLTGLNLLRPLYGPSGELADFALEYLNPAAQRMTGLPQRPDGTARTFFPDIFTNGIFDFYRHVYQTGEMGRYEFNYQADGLDNYFQVAARRSGELLVVSFSDTSEQDRTPVENALRQSQAREQAARAEVEHQRDELLRFVEQATVAVAVYRGPQYRVELANAAALTSWGRSLADVLHRPVFEVLPEAATPDTVTIFDSVFTTGTPYTAYEQPTYITRHGQPEVVYWNVAFQPQRLPDGHISGILTVGIDVTEQVRSRRQVEQLNQALEAQVQERTRQLEAARAEAERQRQLLESVLTQAPVAIGLFQGNDLVITQANDRLCAMWGHEAAQVLGKPLLEGVPELRGQGFDELIREVSRTHVPFVGTEMPAALRQADGRLKTHYFNFVYQPLYGPAGELLGVLDIATDITQQVEVRQQAEALQAELLGAAQRQAAQRETFYQVFEQTPAAICIQRGPEHIYQYVNPAYQALFPDRQFLGRSVAEALPESLPQGFVALLDKVYHTGDTFFGRELPVTLTHPDGSPQRTIYFNFTYQAYQENGQTVGISTFAYDVTEQVEARREREAQQQQLQNLFEQAPVAICLFKGDNYILDIVNPPMAQMLGRSPDQLTGKPFFEALPELVGQGLKELLDRVRLTGVAFVAQERPVQLARHRQGEAGYFTFVYQPLQDAQGQLTGITCVAIEVTEQVQARQQVEQLNTELAAANEELQASSEEIRATNEELTFANQQLTRTNVDLDTFVYTASHDLKAPILNIEGLLYSLQKQIEPEARQKQTVQEIYGLLNSSVNRFKATIADLTEVARIGKESTEDVGTIELAVVLKEVLEDLEPQRQQARAQIEQKLDWLEVHFSRKNLKSVLYNLLSNALKYRSPEREPLVRITCHRQADYQVLQVEDNGLGMDMRQKDKIFVLFKRMHTHVEGTGIGLYIVKKMLENAGGKIEVESQVDVGTTFSVYFRAE